MAPRQDAIQNPSAEEAQVGVGCHPGGADGYASGGGGGSCFGDGGGCAGNRGGVAGAGLDRAAG